MSIIEAIILGLIQGITEFLPVSSSGHLVVAHRLMGVETGGLAFDVALHIGTLLALILFFYKDILQLLKGLLQKTEHSRTAWLLAMATIPAVVSGVLLESAAESSFRSLKLVGLSLIAVALLMIWAEKLYAKQYQMAANMQKISIRQALLMGIAQAIAIVPGVSRSGSTITAGLFGGVDRVAATRFSFLLAMPITFGAIVKVATEPAVTEYIVRDKALFAAGIVTALFSGLFAIRFLIRFLSKHSLTTFAYYRIALGIIILAIAFSN